MTAREDFGEPSGADLLLEVGVIYFRRGLVVNGIRAYLSGLPADVAEAALQAVLLELRGRRE